ncbi:MAG TPA: ABC transporter substrate-binding protein, partial [Microbacterium sp.]|nr:ABC transporter substrate-binding protein [Microbacterium sp.]
MATEISRRSLLRYSILGVGGAAVLGLVGCAPGGSSGPAATPGGSGSTPTDFSFASWSLSEEAAKPPVESAISAFSKAEGISVDTSTYPYNEYLNQLTL